MLAPVVVFAYNRPTHLSKTLTALAQNELAKKSDVFLYIDGPKNPDGLQKQQEVLQCAKNYESGFFRSFTISISDHNKGLSASIIHGVDEAISRFGRAIVIEDDAVSAPSFLQFMNDALEFYQSDPTVWSIGGYTVPVDLPPNYLADVIKTQRVSSYAWAVWGNRWKKINWSMPDYPRFRFAFLQRRAFNRWGRDRASMLDDQMNGRVQSWAIRFDFYMFKNKMFNIVPRRSLIKSIGNDGSGTHNFGIAGKRDLFETSLDQAAFHPKPEFVPVNDFIRKSFCKPFRLPTKYLFMRYLSNQFKFRMKKGE